MSVKNLIAAVLMTAGTAMTPALAAEPAWFPKDAKKPLDSLTIGYAFVGAALNSYVATHGEEFQNYAKEIGVSAIFLDGQLDPAKQSEQVNDLITQQVDAIILWPVNGEALVPAVRRAKDAGIPVVIANTQIADAGKPLTAAFSGPDDFTEGRLSGELMAECLKGKGNVVMIDGLPGYMVATQRHAGFIEGIKESPDIKVIAAEPANFSQEKSQSVMEAMITKYGNTIDGVWTPEAGSGAGALTSVRAAVKDGKLKKGVCMTDATIFGTIYDAIKAGDYYGSVWQAPRTDAQAAMKSAVLAAEGVAQPAMNFFETPKISRANIASFERPNF
jgi:ribose transport system substrate-binding protein